MFTPLDDCVKSWVSIGMAAKKILIIPSWYPNPVEPFKSVFLEEQAIVLTHQYDVLVFFPQLLGYRYLFLDVDGLNARVTYKDKLKIYRWRTLFSFRVPENIYWTYYWWSVKRGFRRLFNKWGMPDLIHAHVVLPTGWVAMKLGQEYHIPVVLTEHFGPFGHHLSSPYKQSLVRETLMKSDRIIAVSPALAQNIRDFCPDIAIDIIGNVIGKEFVTSTEGIVRHKQPARVTRFLSVAAFLKLKGIEYLLKAIQLLVQHDCTSFELILIGEGMEASLLDSKISKLDIASYCRLLGPLPRTEVKSWMQQCDVLVSSSLHETFGMVLVEAMACGKPVIATHCGGPDFIVTPETGILVDPADPVALADAMAGVLTGQFTFDALQIRQSVQKRFGENAFLQNISTVYTQVWNERDSQQNMYVPTRP